MILVFVDNRCWKKISYIKLSYQPVIPYSYFICAVFLPLEVVDEIQLLQIVKDDMVSAVLFYGFSFATVLLFLLFGMAMQDRTSVLYAALFSIALPMLPAMEGYAFYCSLYPGFREFHSLPAP